jgi:hypothetical protein
VAMQVKDIKTLREALTTLGSISSTDRSGKP